VPKLTLSTTPDHHLPEHVSIRKWFCFYGLVFLATAIPLACLISQDPDPFWNMLMAVGRMFKALPQAFYKFWTFLGKLRLAGKEFYVAFKAVDPDAKLLFGALYLSVCTTFIPLPTGFLVSLLCTSASGVGGGFWSCILIVSSMGAVASTIANLNDYHIFMWLLRHRGIAKVRDTKAYRVAAKWFAKAPFAIMVIFNIIHIPVDIPRMLAALYGYPRRLFAASNFVGRFLRYVIIGIITYQLGRKWDWLGPVVFLALGFLIAMYKVLPALVRRLLARRANVPAPAVSDPGKGSQE
jgi:membrane protein YqaA with SNARE-associated domain